MRRIQLYSENGYANMPDIIHSGFPFIIIVGGRGIGKTYGAAATLYNDERRFMWLRRTQNECDIISKAEFHPFKVYLQDHPELPQVKPAVITKYSSAFYKIRQGADGEELQDLIGYSGALSTFASQRSVSMEDVQIVVYDEFIPEKHIRLIKHEDDALLNLYESINRNRELLGRQALQLVMLSNANDLGCPIFQALHLVDVVDRMIKKHQQVYINEKQGLLLINLRDSPVSELKKETALYKLASNSEFGKMSIENDFAYDSHDFVKPQPLNEYVSWVKINDLCIYRHKSERRFYVSRHVSGSPQDYGSGEYAEKNLRRMYSFLYLEFIGGHILFEDYYSKLEFSQLMK